MYIRAAIASAIISFLSLSQAQAVVSQGESDTQKVWDGSEVNPCDGQCTPEWALHNIAGIVPESVVTEWRERLGNDEPFEPLHVFDGDAIVALAEAGPRMTSEPLLAQLDAPEAGAGYVAIRGSSTWVFIVVHEGASPVVVLRDKDFDPIARMGGLTLLSAALPPVWVSEEREGSDTDRSTGAPNGPVSPYGFSGAPPSSPSFAPFGSRPSGSGGFGPEPLDPDAHGPVPGPVPPPSVVPLPPALWMMLTSVGLLLGWKHRTRRSVGRG